MFGFKSKIKKSIMMLSWRRHNSHNSTCMGNIFPLDAVSIGKETYGTLNVLVSNDGYTLSIGNFCSIALGVTFILSSDHYVNHISTYPFKVNMMKSQKYEAISKGNIIVDDDVWIGYGATIMSGVHVGQGAVVAARAVVTKSVPPYAIVGGVPAEILKYRFDNEMIKELVKIDYSKLSKKDIEKHIEEMYVDLKTVSQLDWIPKKE